MLSTGMGQYRARPIVPDHLAALKAKAPSPRAHGQSGLTSADARPESNGEDTRAALNGVLDIGAWADA